MCDCGCNTCETKQPLMMVNESLAPKQILSEGLKYHMDNNKPLTEHLYRAGSTNYFNLFAEARSLYSRGILDITNTDDLALLKETNLGHFGLLEQTSTVSKSRAKAELKQKLKGTRSDGMGKYDGKIYGLDDDGKRIELKSLNDLNKYSKFELAESKKVPLDFPIELNELEPKEFLKAVEDEFDVETLELMKRAIDSRVELLSKMKDVANPRTQVKGYVNRLNEVREPLKDISKEFLTKDMNLIKKGDLFIEVSIDGDKIKIDGGQETEDTVKGISGVRVGTSKRFYETTREVIEALKNIKGRYYKYSITLEKTGFEEEEGVTNYTFYLTPNGIREPLNEVKKKSKKKLNKPMRDSSGGKAYKVYVKDPKTGNIKTIRFGSGGLKAKINNKKARDAFSKRHKCPTKTDKTKASYWSCRLPRYAKLLGLKSNFSGFW